jgi:hypothetical protein
MVSKSSHALRAYVVSSMRSRAMVPALSCRAGGVAAVYALPSLDEPLAR